MAETHEFSRREFQSLVHRAGEGIFFGKGFHRVCLCLSVSRRFPLCLCYLTVFLCLSVGRV